MAGVTIFTALLNWVLPDPRITPESRNCLGAISFTLGFISFLLAIVLIAVGFLPSFPPGVLPPWLSERVLMVAVGGLALIAFLGAWMGVARQRSGGGGGGLPTKGHIKRIADIDILPRRTRLFDSPAAAQFWFEWRRSGLLLPLLIGGLLLAVIGPLSWGLENDSGTTLRILVAALVMPVILAAPVGKGFSKPDFWSADLSLPAFVAIRPLATDEMVVIKMKAAALSALISWLLVLTFLSVCLPLWANLEGLAGLRFDASHYAIAILSILLGVFLTWRFLVGGLWIGLFPATGNCLPRQQFLMPFTGNVAVGGFPVRCAAGYLSPAASPDPHRAARHSISASWSRGVVACEKPAWLRIRFVRWRTQ